MPAALIVRLPNWLGDTVMAVPTVRSLRRHWREGGMILAGPWASLLAGQELADVLVDYPRRWSGRLRTADSVRALGGEVAVLLPNSLEAAVAAQYWGTRRIVGFAGGRSWLLTDPVPPPDPRQHQVDEYLLLGAYLGAASGEREPRLSPPDPDGEERREVRALIRDARGIAAAGSRRARVGVHVSAAYGSAKLWPTERVVELCRMLTRLDLEPVLLGTSGDRAVADTVAGATASVNLVGRDRPGLLAAQLAEVDVLVCGDTGVGHLAAAMGTPVVALFGPTDPAMTAPRGPAAVVRHPVACAPCFYRICPIDHACLRGIEARVVAARIDDLLAGAGR